MEYQTTILGLQEYECLPAIHKVRRESLSIPNVTERGTTDRQTIAAVVHYSYRHNHE